MGRGVAYAAREFPYLLNVPAARLSADSRDPMQFLRFAQRRAPDAGGEDFLPRALYGDYLQDLLAQAERAAPAHIRLVRVFDEVRGITQHGGDKPLAAQCMERPPILADLVILALGNPPRAAAAVGRSAIRDHRAYRHDPWQLPQTLPAGRSVLIVGNGLTMVDAAIALTRDAGARAAAAHDFAARLGASAADGVSAVRLERRWRGAPGLRGFTAAGAGHDARIHPRDRAQGRRLARSRDLHSSFGADPVAASAPARAAAFRAAPAGALGHTPAPAAAAVGRAHRVSAAHRQAAGAWRPHRFDRCGRRAIAGCVASSRRAASRAC